MSLSTKKILCCILISVMVLSITALALYRVFVPKEPQTKVDPETMEQLTEAQRQITVLEEEVALKNSEMEGLRSAIASYENRIAALMDSSTSDNERVKELTEQLSILNARVQALSDQISLKEQQIRDLQNTKTAEERQAVLQQQDALSDITTLLKTISGAPMRNITKSVTYETTDNNGKTVSGSTEITYQTPANISFFYKDLTSGYSLVYNASKARYSASLIKAPYIYSVLSEITEFYRQKYYFGPDGKLLFDENGYKLFEGPHPNYTEDGTLILREGEEKYDLSAPWIYDPQTMYVSGSGKIKNVKEENFTLTVAELFEYTILYSDNIAFNELQKIFGRDSFTAMAAQLGTTGQSKGFMQMSAEDCGKWLEAIYLFVQNDTTVYNEEMTFGQWLNSLMLQSAMNYLLGGGIGSDTMAHKYGWDNDSFHDMGIVYNEHPYVLVLMSDLDEGTEAANNEVAKFFVSFSKAVKKIHTNLYARLPQQP